MTNLETIEAAIKIIDRSTIELSTITRDGYPAPVDPVIEEEMKQEGGYE